MNKRDFYMLKKTLSILLTIAMVLGMSVPAFATSPVTTVISYAVANPPAAEPRLTWTFSETAPSYITYESTYSSVKEGNTKLQQTLDNIGVGVLAGGLSSILPIPTMAQVVAGAILSALPTAFSGSTTLYYRSYEYLTTGGAKYFNKKCSVYIYYDKEMTVLADHVVYYGSKS